MEKQKITYRVFVGKRKGLHGRLTRRCKDNIKMELKWDGMNSTILAQGGDEEGI